MKMDNIKNEEYKILTEKNKLRDDEIDELKEKK